MTNERRFDGPAYQERIDAIAQSGADMHGEASLVRSFQPRSVLDAGCGTGRVAIELSRYEVDVVGVDVDDSMIDEAERLAPTITWVRADLATLDLARAFDVVVLAGNVPLYCRDDSRAALVRSCARHVTTRGKLIAGFQINRGYTLKEFDAALDGTGLTLVERWATWDRDAIHENSDYAVSVYSR